MAYVKILALKSAGHVGNTLEYVENPDKTERQEYLSGYACDPGTAELDFLATKLVAQTMKGKQRADKKPIEAYHIIQSFAPGEVTAEQAHAIGKKLASEFVDGKFEFVIATHVDKGHVHNHIIVNSVSFYHYRKLRTRPYVTIARLREISDRLCLENDLSVIQPEKLGYGYKEWQERKKNTSWKADIRKQINFILARATSYEQFKEYCAELKLYYDDTGKQNRFRLPGQERNVRGDTLDKSGRYSVERIKAQCAANQEQRAEWRRMLREMIPKCDSFPELVEVLADKGVTLKESYQGLVWITEDVQRTEYELGSGFSKAELQKALEEGEYEPETTPPQHPGRVGQQR